MFVDESSREQSAVSVLNSLQSRLSSNPIDYTQWMRQTRRSNTSSDTNKTKTMIVGLPRKFWLLSIIEEFNSAFPFDMKALREERKCSARCRHLPKEPTTDQVAPENPAKIQWLNAQLAS